MRASQGTCSLRSTRSRRSTGHLLALAASASATAALVALLLVGCGADEPDEVECVGPKCVVECEGDACYPELEIVPAEVCDAQFKNCRLTIDQSQVAPGEVLPVSVRIRNTGERSMLIQAMELKYVFPEGIAEPEPAFKLVVPAGYSQAAAEKRPFYIAPLGKASTDVPDDVAATIEFLRYDDGRTRTAELVIDTDASNVVDGLVTIRLSVVAGTPRITVSPEWVNFNNVGLGEQQEQKMNILKIL